jgi:hypothetical protein
MTDIDPYYQSGEAGVEHRNIDAAGDSHPFGDEPKKWEADLRPLIRQVSNELYDSWRATVREYLANAETACLKVKRHQLDPESTPFEEMILPEKYEPRIVVLWDRSEKKLTIQDNGIGMAAVEVDEVFRQIGRSAARDFGSMSGAFGMGALSFPKFIGNENMMVMTSHSRLNDDNAAYLVTLAGIEPVRGSLGDAEYGTKFSLDQKEEDMDIRDAVGKYAEWMRVPVLYRELDENGDEVFNEDWGDRRLYGDYGKSKYTDSFVVPGFFEAYMSSDAPGRTLLLSMQIERNSGDIIDVDNSPYAFDVRILDESGRVVESSNGNEGLIPVPQIEYEQMLLTAREDYITEELLSTKDTIARTGRVDGEDVYCVSEELLNSDKPLPRARFVTDEDSLDEIGPHEVVLGPHKGRTVVDDDVWESLDQGRGANFVSEDELEPYDVSSGQGDLCLPKPTTDRSSLQLNPTFWEYIEAYFIDEYDREIERWRKELQKADDTMAALQEMEPKTVANIRDD